MVEVAQPGQAPAKQTKSNLDFSNLGVVVADQLQQRTAVFADTKQSPQLSEYESIAKKVGIKDVPSVIVYANDKPSVTLLTLNKQMNGKNKEFEAIAISSAAWKLFTKDELNAAMGHEMTHSAKKHAQQFDAMVKSKTPDAEIMAANLTQEKQADKGSVAALCDKTGMIGALRKMLQSQQMETGIVDFNSTLSQRIDTLQLMQITRSPDGKSCQVK